MLKKTFIFCLLAMVYASNILGQNSLLWYDYPKDINAPGSNRGSGITTFNNGHSLLIMEVSGDYVVGGKDTIANKPYRFHYAPDFSLLDLKPVNYTNAPLGIGNSVHGYGNRKDHMYLYLSDLNGTYSFDSLNFQTYNGTQTSNVLIAYDSLGNFVNSFDFDSSSIALFIGVDHNGGPIFFEYSYFGPSQTFRYINLEKDLSAVKSASPWFTVAAPLTNTVYPRIIIPIENDQYLCIGIISGNPDIDPTSAIFQFGSSAPEFYTFLAFMDSNFHVLSAKRLEFNSDVSDVQYSNGKILLLGRYFGSTTINTTSGTLTLPVVPSSNPSLHYDNFILRMDSNLIADWAYYFADTTYGNIYSMNHFNCTMNNPRGMFFCVEIGSSANQTNSGVHLDPADQVVMMFCDTNGNIDLYGHMHHPIIQNKNYPYPQVVLNDSTAFSFNQMNYPINLSMNSVPLYINQGQLGGSVYAAYRLHPEKKYTAKGKLVADLNADFIIDSSDVPINSHSVYSTPSLNSTFSIQDGTYSFLLDSGMNIIKGRNLMHYNSCQPPFYSVILTDSFPEDTSSVFYYSPETFICDLEVKLNGQERARTGQPYSLWGTAANKGTVTSNGSLKINFNRTNLHFDSSTIAPLNIYQDSVVFAPMNLTPLALNQFKLYFSTPQVLPFGTILNFSAMMLPDSTCDYYLPNNEDSLSAIYLNSFDPNYKMIDGPNVVNYNTVDSSFIIPYIIHFQNTGNDTAFKVVLVDTLSSFLDLSSLNNFQASHPYEIALVQGNILVVTFNNILLPDSGTNYAYSEGYFSFEIKPLLPVLNGDVIINHAAIYFDFNEAVVTDPAVIAFTSPAGVESFNHTSGNQLLVVPNPVTKEARLLLKDQQKIEIVEIIDLTGRSLITLSSPIENLPIINTNFLPPGIYIAFVRLENGERLTSKFIKQ